MWSKKNWYCENILITGLTKCNKQALKTLWSTVHKRLAWQVMFFILRVHSQTPCSKTKCFKRYNIRWWFVESISIRQILLTIVPYSWVSFEERNFSRNDWRQDRLTMLIIGEFRLRIRATLTSRMLLVCSEVVSITRYTWNTLALGDTTVAL